MEKVDLKSKRSRTFRRVLSGKKPLRKGRDTIETKKHVSESKTTAYIGGVSVIISAWNTAEYIEECLDSVSSQTWFAKHENWEILLGIDACEKTLEKVKSIMHKYKNLAVFMMDKNVGTYVTCNTLSENAKYEWLLRFDSDDVMYDNMVERLFLNKKDFDLLISYCHEERNRQGKTRLGEGQLFFKKNVFEKFGGFQDWRCASDTELRIRTENHIKQNILNESLFYRRKHDNRLTNSNNTGFQSNYRNEKKEYILQYSKKNPIIKTICENFFCVFDNRIKGIISLTSWKARINTVYKTIETLLKNKNYKIVLCLSKKEFPQKEKELPELLMKHVYNGDVELLWVYENYKALKKFLFTIEKYRNLNIPVISADDDCLYKEGYADELYDKWLQNKNCVIRYNMYNERDDWQFTQGPCTLYPPCVFDILLKIVKKLRSGELKIVKKDDNLITETLLNNNIKIQHVHHGLNFCFTFHDEIKPIHNNRKNPKFKQCYEN